MVSRKGVKVKEVEEKEVHAKAGNGASGSGDEGFFDSSSATVNFIVIDKLAQRAKNGDKKAFCLLLKDLTPFLNGQAKRYYKRIEKRFTVELDPDDVLCEVYLSFVKAVRTYDRSKGPFIPHLKRRIKAELKRYIDNQFKELGMAVEWDDKWHDDPDFIIPSWENGTVKDKKEVKNDGKKAEKEKDDE